MTSTAPATRDEALVARARKVLPGVTQTYSKAPDQHVEGVYPVYLESGTGCRVRDVAGREYIDYPCALGPVILGYRDPEVDAAVHTQVDRGSTFSLGHPLEVEVAELMVSLIPGAEMVRFLKTGSEATTAAVRLARAFTGRDHIAQCGYHGWHDWCVGHAARNAGVPKIVRSLTHQWQYNDLTSLEQVFDAHDKAVACVVMEPVGVERPEAGFLEAVRDLTHERGALLIFDEIITGFRLALGGAQEHFGVLADLAAYGKAMANGYPIAAVVGRADVMAQISTTAFISSTFGGEAVSLAAARATLHALRDRDACAHLWRQGGRIQFEFNRLAAEHRVPVSMLGLPPRRVIAVDTNATTPPNQLKGLLWQECLDRGILLGNANFVSLAHDDQALNETISAFGGAFEDVGRAYHHGRVAQALRGAPPVEVHRRP